MRTPGDQCVDAHVQVGVALEPGSQANVLVTGSAGDGTLRLSDVRMAGQHAQHSASQGAEGVVGARMGVWKSVPTELKGRMTTLAVHSAAPLIAAGSSHQVSLDMSYLGPEPALPVMQAIICSSLVLDSTCCMPCHLVCDMLWLHLLQSSSQ